jgi:hypothetical protein
MVLILGSETGFLARLAMSGKPEVTIIHALPGVRVGGV